MQLVYLWIKSYKNIQNQGFNFSPRFKCTYDEQSNKLVINGNKNYVSIFPSNINITAIVGENGSGKSSLIYQENYQNDVIKIIFRENKFIIFEPTIEKSNTLSPARQTIEIINKTKYKIQHYSAYQEFNNINYICDTVTFDYNINNINYENISNIKHSIYFNTDILTYFDYENFIEEYMYNTTRKNPNLILNLLEDNDKLNYKIFYKKINKKIINYFNKIDFSKFTFIPTEDSILGKEIIDINGRTLFDLSSGEKYLFLITFLLYIEALEKNTDIIIYLDEPDLTLHPQWQKQLISNLIYIFSDFKYIVHFIITTHSPFLLSDIPKENVIFLKKGKQVYPDINTFGANIHTLLSHGFFMENGLMGEFAKKQIDNVINYLNSKKSGIRNNDEAQNIINMIGEPIIKRQLQKMMDSKNINYIATDVKNEIKFLQHRIDLLNKRL